MLATLLTLIATSVVGGVGGLAQAAPAAGVPDCAATSTPTSGCGYYIEINGTPTLVGTNTAGPGVISIGTTLHQTATVAITPTYVTIGNLSYTAGASSVTLAAPGQNDPIISYSPQSGSVQATRIGNSVTWAETDGTNLPAGFTATLDSTVTSTSGTCTKCEGFDARWTSEQGGLGVTGDSTSNFVDERGDTPVAAFTDTQSQPAKDPGQYQFVSDSTDPQGGALDSRWSFGDGSTGTGATVLHTYSEPGTYDATLTVTSSASGFSDSITHQVVVAAPQLQTDISFVDAQGTVLSTLSPKVGDTVHARLTVSATNGVGSISGITFAGGLPLSVTPGAAASIGTPSTAVPKPFTLKPGTEFVTTFPITVLTNGLARFTSTPSGKDAAGHTVTGTTGQRSYEVSGMTIAMSVDPATFAMKEDAKGPVPVDVTVTEKITNTTGAPLTNVVLQSLEPKRVDAGELLAVVYKSGANPDDPALKGNGLPLQPIPAGASDTVTAVYTVNDDGKVDFTSLVTAAADDGSTVRATGSTRMEADPKYFAKFTSTVSTPKQGLLPAGSAIVISGTVTNLTDSDTETLHPMYAGVSGNAGLQSFAWNASGTDPKAFTPADDITLDPGESRDFTLKVLTAYSEPVVGASPLTEKPASGGTRATVTFTPWITVTRDDGTTFDTDKIDTTGSDSSTGDILSTDADLSHQISIDDSIAIPEVDKVAVAQGVLRGGIEGVWNGAAGMVTGLISLPKVSASTLFAVVQYQDRVWASFSEEQKQAFSHDIGLQVASVLDANYQMAKQGLPALIKKANDAAYQYFTKVENQSVTGSYSDTVELYTGFAANALSQVVVPVAIGKLASSRTAVAAVDAAAEAEDAKAASITEGLGDADTVEHAYSSVTDVPSGVDLTPAEVAPMYGIDAPELDRLQSLADKYNVLMVVRSRAASSLKWIKEYAALLKPEAFKIKSVSELDTKLGYPAEYEGALVFKEPQPLIQFRENGGDLADLTRTFVEQQGFVEGTSEYDSAIARVEDRIKEWNKYSATYFKWNKQKWVNTSFNWKGNAMRDPNIGGSGRFSGFKMVPVEGEESTYVLKIYNPKTGTYVPITGDIDPIAFTHTDGTPLTREEHAAIVNELRTDPLLQSQHGESATYVDGGVDFIASQFKADEAGLMIAPGKTPPRTVRFDKSLSIWKSPSNYHLVWEGGFIDAGANPAVSASLQTGFTADGAAAAGATADKVQALPGNGTSTAPNVGRCAITYSATAAPTFMTSAGTLGAITGTAVVPSALESECMTDGPVEQVQVSPTTVSTTSVSAGAVEIPIASAYYGQQTGDDSGFQIGQQVAIDPGQPDAETGTISAFGSIIVSRPLRFAHPAGTLIVTVKAAPPGASPATGPVAATADTGVEHLGSAIGIGLGALAAGSLLTAAGATRRRRPRRCTTMSS